MLRITKQADYGIILMVRLAAEPARVHAAVDLASAAGLPLPMAGKILKRLAHEGLLVSRRGAGGGYSLARDPGSIDVAAIIAALEGPIALTDCLAHGPGGCDHEAGCPTQGHWYWISRAIRDALGGITLAQLCAPPAAAIAAPGWVGLGAIELEGAHHAADRRQHH